jgi:hypothetical protein
VRRLIPIPLVLAAVAVMLPVDPVGAGPATLADLTCSTSRPGAPAATARAVAAYAFEGPGANETPGGPGGSQPATLVDAVSTTGRFGNGLALNGRGAHVRIDEPGWPTRDYTYAAWVFPRDLSGWRGVLEIQTPEGRGLELAIAEGHLEVWSAGTRRLRNGFRLATLAWTHVALTRRGSLITLFVNGVAQRAGRDGTVFDFGRCPALIGVDADSGCTGRLNGFFDGGIDELQVYECALSITGIRWLMEPPGR